MNERIALVTGANSGIGLETAKGLARRGLHVILACRDAERGDEAVAAITGMEMGRKPRLVVVDLSSQRDVRRLADVVHEHYAHLDVLVNNAGAVFERRELTVDGIEKTFATNHLAPFLLTNLVLDLLNAAPGGRIVTVVSEVYPGRLDFLNLQGERQYDFFSAYARSKLENIIFTLELARRLEPMSTTANCVSPGPSRTRFGDNMRGIASFFPKIMKRMPFFASAEAGARGVIRLASSAELAGVSGQLFLKEAELRVKPVAQNADVAHRLWDISEQLTGLARMAA